jgi:hypothetical protein
VLHTKPGALDVFCASGAALDHADPDIRAGYNVYEIDARGAITAAGARALDPSGALLQPALIPEEPSCA